MPRVPAGMVPPAVAEEFSGLTRSSLRALHLAGILPARSRLTSVDVVVARVCRYLYWAGPEASAPGASAERDRVRGIAADVAQHVRDLLASEQVPLAIAVYPSDGRVIAVESQAQWVDISLEPPFEARLAFPLREWMEQAQGLAHGSRERAKADNEEDVEGDQYTYLVRWSESESCYIARTVEFPAFSWLADSPGAAVRGARELVADVVRDMEMHGEEPPVVGTEPDG